jgi:hypothetical protein
MLHKTLPINISQKEFNYLFIDHAFALKCKKQPSYNQNGPTSFEYQPHQVILL